MSATFSITDESKGIIKKIKSSVNVTQWIDKQIKLNFGSISYLKNKVAELEEEIKTYNEAIRLREKYTKEDIGSEFASVEQEVNAGVGWWNRLVHSNTQPIFKLQKYNTAMKKCLDLNEFLKVYEQAEEIIKKRVESGEITPITDGDQYD